MEEKDLFNLGYNEWLDSTCSFPWRNIAERDVYLNGALAAFADDLLDTQGMQAKSDFYKWAWLV